MERSRGRVNQHNSNLRSLSGARHAPPSILVWEFSPADKSPTIVLATHGGRYRRMAHCHNCGTTLTDEDRFCGVCGTPVEAHDPESATTMTVNVPEWLTTDWGPAAKWAAAAVLIALIGHFVILTVLFLGLNVVSGFDLGSFDWGEFLMIPVRVMLSMHGAVEGSSTWITGIAWILGSILITYRIVSMEALPNLPGGSRWISAATRAAKMALVYAGILMVAMIVFDPAPVGFGEFIGPGGFSVDWNPAAGFFTTILIVSIAATLTLMLKAREPRQQSEQYSIWMAGLKGTFRILMIGTLGIISFFLLAGLLILIGDVDEFFTQVVGTLLLLLVTAFAWAGIDLGLLLMAEAMRFFSDDAALSGGNSVFGTSGEGWILFATAIVAIAFLAGGHLAARLSGSRDLSRLVQAAAIAGGGVAVTYIVATAVIGNTVDSIDAGIGLSILWTLVSLGGALIYAQSIGVLQQISVNVQTSGQPAGDGGVCPNCGVPHTPGHKFCASCGHNFD